MSFFFRSAQYFLGRSLSVTASITSVIENHHLFLYSVLRTCLFLNMTILVVSIVLFYIVSNPVSRRIVCAWCDVSRVSDKEPRQGKGLPRFAIGISRACGVQISRVSVFSGFPPAIREMKKGRIMGSYWLPRNRR